VKLNKILEITGKIEIQSGLHIGGGDTEMHIGGTDNPVIKHPHTSDPYIPGSSLKGKIRSLLEWYIGLVEYNDGKPFGYRQLDAVKKQQPEIHNNAINLVKLFGVSGGDVLDAQQAKEIGTTRIAFRDCMVDQEWAMNIKDQNLLLTETKFENSINRISGTAENPRNTERVPAGAQFYFVVNLKQFSNDDEEAMIEMLLKGLKLLELDALGGAGSRGYGKIKFLLTDEKLQEQLEKLDPFQTAA
jgi:CRISPR-associated protein Csm3